MKKSITAIILVAIATISITAHAQWTDRNTFGLKGPVKVVYDTNNGDLQFTENGKYIPQIIRIVDDDMPESIEYNASGKIEYKFNRLKGVDTYKYNNSGLVIEIENRQGTSDLTITSYTYDTKGKVIKQVVKDCYVGQSGTRILSTTTTTYTYQKIDSYGNWTKRTALTNGKRTEETRTIRYYAPSQKPIVPDDILVQEDQGSKSWMVKNKDCKYFTYYPYEKTFSDESSCASFGDVIYGVKIGNYIYEYNGAVDEVYVFNASDCVSVTTSDYIPLTYGGTTGTRLSDGSTMYIVPFKPGHYTVSGALSKTQLAGTYVMVSVNPKWEEALKGRCYTAVVNITKTQKGFCLTNAYGIYGKDYSPKNIVSKTGMLLRNAIIEKGEQDMVCYPKWVIEFPGLIEDGIPIGFVIK